MDQLQEMVLEAMGVDEIIHPEEETAERWAKKLNFEGVVDSFEVTGEYSSIETEVPKEFDGRSLEEIGLKRNYNIIVLTTIRTTQEKNEIGASKNLAHVQGVASAKTKLHLGEFMVL